MNTQVEKVQAWLIANKLSVHYVDKSKYMLVNKNNNQRIEDGDFELMMGGHIISRTKTYRYLGLLVDEKFPGLTILMKFAGNSLRWLVSFSKYYVCSFSGV